jgi:hypothetical protein
VAGVNIVQCITDFDVHIVVSFPSCTGKEFAIKFCPRSATQYGGGGSGKDGWAGSETGSDSGDSKVTTLMADDAEVIFLCLFPPEWYYSDRSLTCFPLLRCCAQTRMLWVTMLQRALAIATEETASVR